MSLDPRNNRILNSYAIALRNRFDRVAMLGLPHLEDAEDLPVSDIFVWQQIGNSPVAADAREEDLTGVGLLRGMVTCKRMLLMGEPGMGKSTLIQWLVTSLSVWQDNLANDRLGRVVPIPFILRDMKIGPEVHDLESLLDCLNGFRWWTNEVRSTLLPWWEAGKVLLLVDGYDELGREVQARLRAALRDAVQRYPDIHLLITSRVLGHAETPLVEIRTDIQNLQRSLDFSRELARVRPDPKGTAFAVEPSPSIRVAEPPAEPESFAPPPPRSELSIPGLEVRHLLPFNREQIQTFCTRWYRLREADPDIAAVRAANLPKVIEARPDLLSLARVPNLLTLMAIIHRVHTELPQGRARLFGKIVEAYLESIDSARKLERLHIPLEVRRRWLGELALKMEEQRFEEETRLTIRKDEAIQVLLSAGAKEEEAGSFLKETMTRSGLLVPRSEELLAFAHLSIQDYLAAVRLKEMLEVGFFDEELVNQAMDWIRRIASKNKNGVVELICILFQVVAEKPRFAPGLVKKLRQHGWRFPGELAQELLKEDSCGVNSTDVAPLLEADRDEAIRGMLKGKKLVVETWVENLEALRGAEVEEVDVEFPGRLNSAATLKSFQGLAKVNWGGTWIPFLELLDMKLGDLLVIGNAESRWTSLELFSPKLKTYTVIGDSEFLSRAPLPRESETLMILGFDSEGDFFSIDRLAGGKFNVISFRSVSVSGQAKTKVDCKLVITEDISNLKHLSGCDGVSLQGDGIADQLSELPTDLPSSVRYLSLTDCPRVIDLTPVLKTGVHLLHLSGTGVYKLPIGHRWMLFGPDAERFPPAQRVPAKMRKKK